MLFKDPKSLTELGTQIANKDNTQDSKQRITRHKAQQGTKTVVGRGVDNSGTDK